MAGPFYFLKRRPIQELHIGNFSCSGDLLRNSVGHKKSDGFVQPPPRKNNIKNTLLRWTFQGFASSFSLGYRKEVLWEPFNDGQQMLWEELKKLLKPNEKTTSLRCVPCRSRDLEPCSLGKMQERGHVCVLWWFVFFLAKQAWWRPRCKDKEERGFIQSITQSPTGQPPAGQSPKIWLIVCRKILPRGFDTPETRLF